MKITNTINGNNLFLKSLELNNISIHYLNWLRDKEVNYYLETKHEKQSLSKIRSFVSTCNKSKDTYFNVQRDKIASINKLLESLSYKSIINRGYSVVKNSKEKVLKAEKDILSDKKLIIETKFGILQSNLSIEKNEQES